MNAISKILSGLALASASLYAAAAPISVTDTMSLSLPVTSAAATSFIIDLTDNSTSYVAGPGSVINATLRLVLSDPLQGNEKYSIFFGSNPVAAIAGNNIVNSGTQTMTVALDAVALADLSADGKLTVILRAALQGGDDGVANYLAVSSVLDANPVAAESIPEPASLGLMGITLAGLVATRRRKQK